MSHAYTLMRGSRWLSFFSQKAFYTLASKITTSANGWVQR